MFWKPAPFPFIGKESPNLLDTLDQVSAMGTTETLTLYDMHLTTDLVQG